MLHCNSRARFFLFDIECLRFCAVASSVYGYAFFYCFSVHENVKFPVGNAIYYVLYSVYLARGNSMTHTHTQWLFRISWEFANWFSLQTSKKYNISQHLGYIDLIETLVALHKSHIVYGSYLWHDKIIHHRQLMQLQIDKNRQSTWYEW